MNPKVPKGMVIGISGKIGSGKDTVANIIMNHGFQIETFASNVRKVCSILTGVPYETLLHRDAKGLKIKYHNKEIYMGQLFQIIGNGLRESVHEDVWLNALFNNLQPNSRVVIPDLRYPNEYQEIQRRGGICIRVEGDPAKIREDMKSGKSSDKRDLNAPSETALDQYAFPYIIYNNGTLEDLYKKVENVLNSIK